MGIDGIGKPPGVSIGSVGGVTGTETPRTGEAFSVDRASPSAPAERVSAALGSLQRGEISLDQYLDTRVTEATTHLSGKLSSEQLGFVKQTLREQLATDPVLVELVKRATGSSPAAEQT